MPSGRRVAGLLAVALAAAAAYGLLTWFLRSGTGLTETFYHGVGPGRTPVSERRTTRIGLGMTAERPDLVRDVFSVRWTGVWYVPKTDIYAIHLEGDDLARLRLDDRLAHAFWVREDAARPIRAVPLTRGFHRLELEYEQHGASRNLVVQAAPFGDAPRPLDPESLYPSLPQRPWALAAARTIRTIAVWVLAAVALTLALLVSGPVRVGTRAILERKVGTRPSLTLGRVLATAAVVIITSYGAVLRLDALTFTQGVVERPAWLRALQESRLSPSAIRPDSFVWERRVGRYTSDPYTYLQYAREMRSFYAAHRREPLFPFATKVSLALLSDQDVAVSFASAFFSTLVIVATFLLGAYAFSYWVGLGAAAAVAIEYDLITWGIAGWRDDAFTCAVVASAYVFLRYARDPSRKNALLAGAVGGVACLIRITSLSFLLPGFLFLLVAAGRPTRARTKGVALAVLAMTVVIGPYLFNCWREFGDPLYSINVHADVYRAAEGTLEGSETASEYLRGKARREPLRTLETAVLGMTSYPFTNKWVGFARWHPRLGVWLSIASLAGLFLFVGSLAGRLLLVMLAGSLVPYAMTWRLIFDWRFTEHAYPIFLVAAFYALIQAVRLIASFDGLRMSWPPRPGRRRVLLWGGALALVALGAWATAWWLPVLTMRETLLDGEGTTIMAGARDGAFFGDGWSRPLNEGITARVTTAEHPELRLPLPRVQDYTVTMRLDPFPRPLGEPRGLPTVRVFLNNRLVAHVQLGWNPERVGAYDIRLPANAVKAGANKLVLMPTTAAGADSDVAGLRLWYLRVRNHGP